MDLSFWLNLIGSPESWYDFTPVVIRRNTYDYDDFTCEYYEQQNGPDTHQRVMMLVPKQPSSPRPAVVVPFYFPEAMLGEEPDTREQLPNYAGIEMMRHLVKRGFITVSAEAYHLTYVPDLTLDRNDFQRWARSAAKLNADHPHWSGVGKLVSDTRLLIDMLCSDKRVDSDRIGIAGHSLGGKMAFYTGCIDARIKVILTSDFGILWNQTNWSDAWYWGKERVAAFEAEGIDHASLLKASNCKPFALLAGNYDNENSLPLLQKAGYNDDSCRLCFINHATGHRPPSWALNKGYDFLEQNLIIDKNIC